MTLEQTIRLQRRRAQRQLRVIHRLGRWPRAIRKVSLFVMKHGFSMKLHQIRSMAEAGVEPAMIREYVRSKAAIF